MADTGTSRGEARRDWLLPGGRPETRGPDRERRQGRDQETRRRQPDRPAPQQDDRRPSRERTPPQTDEGERQDRDGHGPTSQPKKPLPKWPFVLAAVVVLAFVGVVLWLIFRPRPDAYTDDAYVAVHYTTVAPRIAGRISALPVDDDQVVKAGDLLAQLDPRDQQNAVAAAEAQVERDTAQTGDVAANVERQPALIDERQADLASTQARLAFAQADARRFDNLAAAGAGTNQQRQQADATLAQAQAAVQAAEASLAAAKKQLDVLRQQKRSSEAAVKADRARLEQARLDLDYTRVLAPLDGMVGQRSAQVGDYVTPGKTLMVVVPLAEVYVQANYREVDLQHVRAGQPATVHIDAYGIDLRGRVNGVPAASTAVFAPIAPNNATGNFTKIVQRLPVRIDIEPGQPEAKLLRAGFSVETTIHTGLEDVAAEQRTDPRAVTGR